MVKRLGVIAEVETTPLAIDVSGAPGGAGIAVAYVSSTSNVSLTNTSSGANLEYRVDAGAWQKLGPSDGIDLPINLSSQSLYLRRQRYDGGLVKALLVAEGIATLRASTGGLPIVAGSGSSATKPGQPAKPVLTAMANSVSLAWTAGAAGSSATTGNTWTDINGVSTPLTTNPQVISAPAGALYTGTVTTTNAQGAGLPSAQADAVTPTATVATRNSGISRIFGTQAQIAEPTPDSASGWIMKVQAPGPAVGVTMYIHNKSGIQQFAGVKLSIAATDIAAVDTVAHAYHALSDGTAHNNDASTADPKGFRKATWAGATSSPMLDSTNSVLPSFGYSNQIVTAATDKIAGLVPKRATDRTSEEYYYIVRLARATVVGQAQSSVVAAEVDKNTALWTSSNGADALWLSGAYTPNTENVDAYPVPTGLQTNALPMISFEWDFGAGVTPTTFWNDGDSITEAYQWNQVAVQRKSTPAKPLLTVDIGGSTTRTESFLGNLYLHLQTMTKPDYIVFPIISVNNYSPLSSFAQADAVNEITRLKDMAAFCASMGIKLIWWVPFNFGANPATPGDVSTPYFYVYTNAKAYAAANGITFMDINGDPRLVRSVYNASTNPTGWLAADNTHPSDPPGKAGFATIFGETLTSLGF